MGVKDNNPNNPSYSMIIILVKLNSLTILNKAKRCQVLDKNSSNCLSKTPLLCKAVFLINSLRNFCRVLDNVLLCLKWLSYLIILFNLKKCINWTDSKFLRFKTILILIIIFTILFFDLTSTFLGANKSLIDFD